MTSASVGTPVIVAGHQIRKVVIPAAGLGTRLRPATKSQPKEMLPVGRKPTIQYVVEECIAAGLTSILLITGRHKRAIEDHFDIDLVTENGISPNEPDYRALGVRFFFVRQHEQSGLADAISHAEEFVSGDDFVVALGDTIIGAERSGSLLRRLVGTHLEHHAACTVAAEEVASADVSKYGIMQPAGDTDDRFPLAGLIEKPSPHEAPSRLAIASRYVFSAEVFDAIREIKSRPPGRGGEYQLTDAMRLLLGDGRQVWAVRLADNERRFDIGGFGSYYAAFLQHALRDPEHGEELRAAMAALIEK